MQKNQKTIDLDVKVKVYNILVKLYQGGKNEKISHK